MHYVFQRTLAAGEKVGHHLLINVMKSSQYDYLTGNYSNSMFFTPVTKIEIVDIINSLKNSTSKGHDYITTNIVKECKYQFVHLLMHLVNN